MQAKGVAATVEFDGQAVTITRTALSPQGRGTKTIPLRQISAVQFKPASLLTRGFIAFTIGGGEERRSRTGRQAFDAITDENAVPFGGKAKADFQALADAVNAAIRDVS